MLYADGNREIPEWAEEQYPGNNLTRHDTMMLYSINYPGTGPNASSYYCTNVKNLAACMLGGGTSVNAAQQWWPPRKYLDNTFKNFTGWTGNSFQEAIQRVADRIPPTATWSSDGKVCYASLLLKLDQVANKAVALLRPRIPSDGISAQIHRYYRG